jgi:ParB/RepB/Spo0J family partition protein
MEKQEATLQVEWVPIDRLALNPANPRHNDDAVEHVAASLRKFGFQQPLVVKRSGEVIAGNTRLKAAKLLGLTSIPVVWFDGNDLEATAYAIADNRTHEFATWDEKALADLLEVLRHEDALEGVGYSEADIDALLSELKDADGGHQDIDDPGPDEPPAQPVSRLGDLWILGGASGHRLLCGDSTKASDVASVMAGEQAALCATDPPFSVGYTGERPHDAGKDWSATYHEVDLKDAAPFFTSIFTNVLAVLARNGAIYCWHSHKQCGVLQRVWAELGILDHQQIVWVKPTAVFGRVYWSFRHEPCLMGWRKGEPPDHDDKNEFNSVWEIDWDGKARVVGNEHPTEKPLEIFMRPMRKHTKVGAIVFEPFSGSGSQILAAETLRRRCFAIEISPAYVDVAIRRFERATGKAATLETTGETFAQVAAARGVLVGEAVEGDEGP